MGREVIIKCKLQVQILGNLFRELNKIGNKMNIKLRGGGHNKQDFFPNPLFSIKILAFDLISTD